MAIAAPHARANTPKGDMEIKIRPGVYWPGPYYSQQYLQPPPLRPGQKVLFYRMLPFEHYGDYRYGVAVPGLTNGTVQSDRFPYRYRYGFEPTEGPKPRYVDECDLPPRSFRERRR